MTRARWIAGVLLIGGAVVTYVATPPAARSLPQSNGLRMPVRGVIHVHTRRSDGTGTADSIADAAGQAGLNFVIFTDHGDAARDPEPPVYLHGVLCIDAVEISTDGGHVVALGLPRSPYPLGGEARDVVEDIERLGGMAIAAHPSSAKRDLRWSDWSVPVDGLEWLNGDSEWRDERLRHLARALLTYPFRRAETLATLLDRPTETLRQWDGLTAKRQVVAVAGADAHARIGVEPYDNRISLRVPGYAQVFRAFSVSLPNVTLNGDARADARVVLNAVRRGDVFSSIDALARPAVMSLSMTSGGVRAGMGEDLVMRGSVTVQVKSNAPQTAAVSLLRDGRIVSTATGPDLQYESDETGVYRVEIQLPGAPGDPPIPWLVSNPVYVLPVARHAEATESDPPSTDLSSRYADGPAEGWGIEKTAKSQGAFDVVRSVGGGTQLSLRYGLGGAESDSPFVALVMPVNEGLANYNRIVFTARLSRPARMFVQVRAPDGPQGQNWHRSVFLDETARTVTVMFNDMRPLGPTPNAQPLLGNVRSVLFVIDTTHTRPGMNGQVWIDDVKLGK